MSSFTLFAIGFVTGILSLPAACAGMVWMDWKQSKSDRH